MSLINFIFVCGFLHSVQIHFDSIHRLVLYDAAGWERAQESPEYKQLLEQTAPDITHTVIDSKSGVSCL